MNCQCRAEGKKGGRSEDRPPIPALLFAYALLPLYAAHSTVQEISPL